MITTRLWFNPDREGAAQFYASIFPNSRLEGFNPTTDTGPGEPGSVLSGSFVRRAAIYRHHRRPALPFTEAVSFTINCKDQGEVDYYWNRLAADGGQESQCGWCKTSLA